MCRIHLFFVWWKFSMTFLKRCVILPAMKRMRTGDRMSNMGLERVLGDVNRRKDLSVESSWIRKMLKKRTISILICLFFVCHSSLDAISGRHIVFHSSAFPDPSQNKRDKQHMCALFTIRDKIKVPTASASTESKYICKLLYLIIIVYLLHVQQGFQKLITDKSLKKHFSPKTHKKVIKRFLEGRNMLPFATSTTIFFPARRYFISLVTAAGTKYEFVRALHITNITYTSRVNWHKRYENETIERLLERKIFHKFQLYVPI